MAKIRQKFKLIYIEWADTTSPMNGKSWWDREEAIRWAEEQDYWVCQAGFVIKETKEYLLLAGHYNITAVDEETLESLGQIIRIPKTWIRKRKEIKI